MVQPACTPGTRGAQAPLRCSARSLLWAQAQTLQSVSLSELGSCCRTSQTGWSWLGTGLWVGLASSSTGSTVSGNPQDTNTHSTNSTRLPRGPSPDNCVLVVVLRPAIRNEHRQSSGKVAWWARLRNSFEGAITLFKAEEANCREVHGERKKYIKRSKKHKKTPLIFSRSGLLSQLVGNTCTRMKMKDQKSFSHMLYSKSFEVISSMKIWTLNEIVKSHLHCY